jgi:outer membrane protein assembly factor BamB
LEPIHRAIGSYAQATCAANESCVVSFFGSAGLFCYDPSGELLWRKTFAPFNNDEGAASSPILVGDRVLLNQDHDTDSFLIALSLRDGSTIWSVDRSEFIRGYSTPVIWNNNGECQIAVSGSLAVTGYDVNDGHEMWRAGGLSWGVVSTPVIGADGLLFVPSLDARVVDVTDRAPPFNELDTDGNSVVDRNEFAAAESMTEFFTHFDRNKDGQVAPAEYESIRSFWKASRSAVIAIRPGGKGDITSTHVAWSSDRAVPIVPSPLYVDGTLFVVRNGGIVTCLDAASGKAGRSRRVSGRGDYYASPIAGDGKIYLASQRGDVSVITAERSWREVAKAQFDEEVYATPAIADGRIYLRTTGHLYCFGYADPQEVLSRQTSAQRQRIVQTAIVGVAAICAVVLGWRSYWIRRRRSESAAPFRNGKR